jgi:hypothetical protein
MISVIRVRELDRNWLLAFTVVIKPKKKKKKKKSIRARWSGAYL